MSKRFTQTGKWEDEWFMSLELKHKVFWLYILDRCDHAGIWEINMALANYMIGEKLTRDEISKVFGERIMILSDSKRLWIKKFCEFQYGPLRADNKTHRSVLRRLSAFHEIPMESIGIHGENGDSQSSHRGAKDKDKDKVKDKPKPLMQDERTARGSHVQLSLAEYAALEANIKDGRTALERYIGAVNDYCASKGKKYKDWAATIRAWARKDGAWNGDEREMSLEERKAMYAKPL